MSQNIQISVQARNKDTERTFFITYPKNIVIAVQHNILMIFTLHFGKINQTYFIFYCNFINE